MLTILPILNGAEEKQEETHRCQGGAESEPGTELTYPAGGQTKLGYLYRPGQKWLASQPHCDACLRVYRPSTAGAGGSPLRTKSSSRMYSWMAATPFDVSRSYLSANGTRKLAFRVMPSHQ